MPIFLTSQAAFFNPDGACREPTPRELSNRSPRHHLCHTATTTAPTAITTTISTTMTTIQSTITDHDQDYDDDVDVRCLITHKPPFNCKD